MVSLGLPISSFGQKKPRLALFNEIGNQPTGGSKRGRGRGRGHGQVKVEGKYKIEHQNGFIICQVIVLTVF